MNGTFTITIGTGKNGTHCLDSMIRAGATGPIQSIHEPQPFMDDLELLLYEGRIEPNQVHRHWVFQKFVEMVRENRAEKNLHIANNHLTCLVPRIEREFPDVKIILPIRRDWRACAYGLYGHGCYRRDWLFLAPRDMELRLHWSRLSPLAKCVWLVRTKNRIAEQITKKAGNRGLICATESLDNLGLRLSDFLGIPFDKDAAMRMAKTKPGASGITPCDRHFKEDEQDINDVVQGAYDEQTPEL